MRRLWWDHDLSFRPSVDASSLLVGDPVFYRLADTSDATPNGLTLTNNNAATFVAGRVGNCANLVAASNQWLSRASSTKFLLDASTSLTVSCWVNHTTLQALSGAVNKGSPTAGGGGEWGLEFLGSSTNKYRFVVRNTGNTSSLATTSAVTITTGAWHHLLGWWDAVAKTINISVNGETPVSASFPTGGFAGTNDLNIGYWVASGVRFNGQIDAVGVWNRVLTAAERAALYNNGNGVEYPFF